MQNFVLAKKEQQEQEELMMMRPKANKRWLFWIKTFPHKLNRKRIRETGGGEWTHKIIIMQNKMDYAIITSVAISKVIRYIFWKTAENNSYCYQDLGTH